MQNINFIFFTEYENENLVGHGFPASEMWGNQNHTARPRQGLYSPRKGGGAPGRGTQIPRGPIGGANFFVSFGFFFLQKGGFEFFSPCGATLTGAPGLWS